MRVRANPAFSLRSLTRVEDPAERRANWRQAIAALGHHAGTVRAAAPPLEGIPQEELVHAAELAIDLGLADELDFLADGPAAVALYEIMAAIPPGKVRRELGRRVFARLYAGNAATFAAVALRMALTSSRPFESAPLRARVSLLFDLPIGSQVNADPLALTLVTRRELRERWIDAQRTGPLPARRLAAKLIEHAAREAVSRAQQGDAYPRELLASDPVRVAYTALLADREPLVWRHAAVARGFLAAVDPNVRQEIELGLDPALSPTEWRRSAVSLVALCVSDPTGAGRSCHKLLSGPIPELDRGIGATIVLGLPRLIEAEPEVALALLEKLLKLGRPDILEAVVSLLTHVQAGSFENSVKGMVKAALKAQRSAPGSPLRAILERAEQRLEQGRGALDGASLLRQALEAYEARGAEPAFELATQAVRAIGLEVDYIALVDGENDQLLPRVLAALSDIDATALERPTLRELLLLGRRLADTDAAVPELDQQFDRLGRWLVDTERNAPGPSTSVLHAFCAQRRLRTLLHLMDIDSTRQEDDKRVRARVTATIRHLLPRARGEHGSPTHRVACAALARAFDAAIRENLAEPADLLLALANDVEAAVTYRMLAEASTNPDVRGVIAAYGLFLSGDSLESIEPAEQSSAYDSRNPSAEEEMRIAERVARLSRALGAGGSYRGEALRRIVLRIGRALEAVASARGQTELVDSGGGHDILGELEDALEDLRRLSQGALRRVYGEGPQEPGLGGSSGSVATLVERSVQSGVGVAPEQLSIAIRELTQRLPAAIGLSVDRVLRRIAGLPFATQSDVFAIPLERRRAMLPDWLLPQRTIGAFYVVRPLGSGGASSVFVARRVEQRNNARVESFALKVPDYDPMTARSLSEQEFLQLFREEAGALLALPEHQNLARFVTFDAGARPKPILVMELIRGMSLDRLVRSQSLTTARVIGILDGILSGLRAMHGVGVAHLDVKPSNVILRDGEIPVLVDFGLSGRHLRPGCGTLEYCSPEVLGLTHSGWMPEPLPSDIYAFGCLAFEAMTGELLFDGDEETNLSAQHISHDGWPERLLGLARAPETLEFSKLLAACLRHDPRNRPTASQAQRALQRLAPTLNGLTWPLALHATRKAG